MSDFFVRILQYSLPKRWLTQCLGKLATLEAGKLTTWIIRAFVKRYQVNMQEALETDLTRYRTFNAFFTRLLRPEVRPLATAEFVSPVDGTISQLGPIAGEHLFQAKGHRYTLTALLGGDHALAAKFTQGTFATLYLSPKDYHRIHMPLAGTLRQMTYVPGQLFSVNPATARVVPGLFARNERVICEFASPQGPWALVLVGATIVGSMATVWHGIINPPRSRKIRRWHYKSNEINLQQGQEMGRFLLGSTVIMLAPPDMLHFPDDWCPGRTIRMGEAMSALPLATAKQASI